MFSFFLFLFQTSSTTGLFQKHQSKQLWCRQFIYFPEFWSSLAKQCPFTKPYGICKCFDMRIPQYACIFFSIYGWYKLLQWTVRVDLIHIIYKIGVWCEHIIYTAKLICQDKTVGKTQSWIESWISISSSPLKYFLLYICLENPRLIFYSFTPLFLLYKPEIPTKQTGLINRFVIPPRNLCTCVQKSKSKHDGGAHVFFLFPHVTHGIVRYLIPKEICTTKWKKKLPAKNKTIHS